MSCLYLHKSPTSRNVIAFAVARIARVIPLFLAVLVGSFILKRFDFLGQFVYEINNVIDFASHIFLLHGTSILWTIPTELHFYALFALAWICRPRLGATIYIIISLIILIDFMWGFRYDTTSILGLTVTPTIIIALPYFVVGAVMGHVYRSWQPPEGLSNNYFVLVLALIPLLFPNTFYYITGRQHGMWSDMGVLLFVSGIFFVFVFLIPNENKIISNTVGDFFGRISYSLYLLHMPLLLLFRYLGLIQGVFGLILFIATTSVVSQLSFALLEHPSRKFIKARLSNNKT